MALYDRTKKRFRKRYKSARKNVLGEYLENKEKEVVDIMTMRSYLECEINEAEREARRDERMEIAGEMLHN